MPATHRLDKSVAHYEWNNAIPARLVADPGDTLESAQHAVRYLIDHMVAERGLTREEAYVVASVAADLKISEIVDAPNWIVSAFLPESIFS